MQWRRPTFMFVLVLLAGGAIVNVAVAWGFAWLLTGFPGRTPDTYGNRLTASHITTSGHGWRIGRADRLGVCQVIAVPIPRGPTASERTQVWSDEGVYPYWTDWPDGLNTILNPAAHVVQASGWPMPAMRARYSSQRWVSGIALRTHDNGRGPAPNLSSGTHRALPVEVIWPGFVVNTLFYAVLLSGLFAVAAALSRKRRIKRGLCPMCAYPIGATGLCTECGATITPAPTAAASRL